MANSGLLIVDKPQGVTSHDIVAAVRGALHMKRVGHAGTLDPMATGALIVGFGNATRLLNVIVEHDKTYEAAVRNNVHILFDPVGRSLVDHKSVVPVARILGDHLCSNFIIFRIRLIQLIKLLESLKLSLILRQPGIFLRQLRDLLLQLLIFSGQLFDVLKSIQLSAHPGADLIDPVLKRHDDSARRLPQRSDGNDLCKGQQNGADTQKSHQNQQVFTFHLKLFFLVHVTSFYYL